MAIKINHNIFSTLVQRHLSRSTQRLEQSFERLSSGERINSAADDPAGLATSEQLRYEVQGVRQNQRNIGNALSLIGTAESHSDRVVNMLQRARELAVQAGNTTLSAENRRAIQGELEQIIEEIDRMADTTRFGDRRLFDGGFIGVRIQVGTRESEFLTLSLGDYHTNVLGTRASIIGGMVSQAALAAGQITVNGVAVPASLPDGVSVFAPAASAEAKAAAINRIEGQTGVHATVVPATVTGMTAIQPMTLDAANQLTINGIQIPAMPVSAGDASRELVTVINQQSVATGVKAEIDSAGRLTLTAVDGRNIRIETTGNVAQQLGWSGAPGPQTIDLTGSVELTASRPFSVEDPAGTIGLGASQVVNGDPSSAIRGIDLTTMDGVARALRSLDAAIEQVGAERARLGMLNNRLDSVTDTLARQIEDLTASDSRIRDADVALETARMAQAQILQQASMAMLTQANIMPQRALELLMQ